MRAVEVGRGGRAGQSERRHVALLLLVRLHLLPSPSPLCAALRVSASVLMHSSNPRFPPLVSSLSLPSPSLRCCRFPRQALTSSRRCPSAPARTRTRASAPAGPFLSSLCESRAEGFGWRLCGVPSVDGAASHGRRGGVRDRVRSSREGGRRESENTGRGANCRHAPPFPPPLALRRRGRRRPWCASASSPPRPTPGAALHKNCEACHWVGGGAVP